jgi:hypothetical protein
MAALVGLVAALPGRVAAQDRSLLQPRPMSTFMSPAPHPASPFARWRLLFAGKRKLRLSDRVYAEVRAPGARRYVPFKLVITF